MKELEEVDRIIKQRETGIQTTKIEIKNSHIKAGGCFIIFLLIFPIFHFLFLIFPVYPQFPLKLIIMMYFCRRGGGTIILVSIIPFLHRFAVSSFFFPFLLVDFLIMTFGEYKGSLYQQRNHKT